MKRAFTIAATTLVAGAFLAGPVFAQEKGHRLAACKPDIEKFCSAEPRGQGKIKACLEANKDKLATECKTALESASQ